MFRGRLFFEFFWLTYIALIGLMGLSLAMMAGKLWAGGHLTTALVATVLGIICALLCGVADDTVRALRADR